MNLLKVIYFILITLFAIILDTTILGFIFAGEPGAKPNILLALVVLMGLFIRPREGAVYAFIIGYIEDIMLNPFAGMYMFNRVAIYLISYQLSRRLYSRSAGVQFVIIFLLSIVDFILYLILSAIFAPPAVFNTFFLVRAFLNGFFGIFLFFILKRIWTSSPEFSTERMERMESTNSHM